MFVCFFTYGSRTDKPICTKLGMLIPWDKEEDKGGSKLRESVLCSTPEEGGSCSSDTKHDRRTASRPKFYRNEGQKPKKLSWVRLPIKMVFVARKLSTTELRKEQNCLFRRDYTNLVTNPKTVLGSSLGENFGNMDNFDIILNDTWPSGWHTTWHLQTHEEGRNDRRRDADKRYHL
jgi:hypothetical protein